MIPERLEARDRRKARQLVDRRDDLEARRAVADLRDLLASARLPVDRVHKCR
jgi:hypothetical protein